jgi:hypothetical protein
MPHIKITARDGADVRVTPIMLKRFPKDWTGPVPDDAAKTLVADGLAVLVDATEPEPELTGRRARVLAAAADHVIAQQAAAAEAAAAAELTVEPIDEAAPPPDPAAGRKAAVKAARKAGKDPS